MNTSNDQNINSNNTNQSNQAVQNNVNMVQNPQVSNVAPSTQQVPPVAQTQSVNPVASQIATPQVVSNPQVQPVTPASNATQPVTPAVSQPAVQPQVTPVPAQSVTPTPVQPVAQVQSVTPVTPQPQQVTPTVPVSASGEEVVINTTKKRASNIIMFILLGLLILLVFNMDTVIDKINEYRNNKNLPSDNTTYTDNLVSGYILIDDTSYMKLNEIRFYNFKKSSDNTEITFNYEVNKKYDDSASLNMYIELYNSDKQILYKELFDTKSPLELNTIRNYTLSVTNDVYESAFYALVKVYTNEELEKTDTLVCTFTETNENYTIISKNTYNFKNNSLQSYNVNKQINITNPEVVTENVLEKEYNDISAVIQNAKFENNILDYNVDLSQNIEGFSPLYNKDTIITILKNKEELKKWICNNG